MLRTSIRSMWLLAVVWPGATLAAPLCSLNPLGNSETITVGIAYQPYQVTCPESADGGPAIPQPAPNQANMHLVTVVLGTPNLAVMASVPPNPTSGPPGSVVSQTFDVTLPSAVFPKVASARAGSAPVPQVAINANLFTHCCTDTYASPPAAADKLTTALRGLEMANSQTYTSPLANLDNIIPYATFASSLLIDSSMRASIWEATSTLSAVPANTVTAVTGSHQIVTNSQNTATSCMPPLSGKPETRCGPRSWLGPNARTGVGVIGQSTLLMVVFDGVDNKSGASLYQFGDVLTQLKADDAINLDGGGSSTLARIDDTTGFTILSTLTDASNAPCSVQAPSSKAPHGTGCERYVGAVLYVTAP